ncbi:Putative protein of unknown function [Podospora comata]|uniref:Uncharacterized protein n=1 Tax=Podospora comata TaxID=48703 RepID=A0ABY6SB63_PODCO|nr:Putative protein of unknown function [Podospora comata]
MGSNNPPPQSFSHMLRRNFASGSRLF